MSWSPSSTGWCRSDGSRHWPSHEEWDALYEDIVSSRPGDSNTEAWRRCLAIMRYLGAKTVIFEEHYVCLEYKSEFITFYAHVDKALPMVTKRLHFLDREIDRSHLGRLTCLERKSYLGYIVVRPADLPIVGRAHIKTPDFVDVSTAVTDRVHLFGQSLEVAGVPFMEQESRMAECGNVSLWVIHHTAFLRRIFERRFIADFVDMPEKRWPMRVSSPEGIRDKGRHACSTTLVSTRYGRTPDDQWLPPTIAWTDYLDAWETGVDHAEMERPRRRLIWRRRALRAAPPESIPATLEPGCITRAEKAKRIVADQD